MTRIRLSLLGDCTIYVNGTAVDSSSTHLFALLLILCLDHERRVPRAELHQLLFGSDAGQPQVAHNLRQLLYRIRRLGIELDETATGIRIPHDAVTPFDSSLHTITASDCERLDANAVAFLPSYLPRLPHPYQEWLDSRRDTAENTIRNTLRKVLTELRGAHMWTAVSRVGKILLAGDPHSEEAASATAEALSMLGRREEAISVLDVFKRATSSDDALADGITALRTRVARAPHTHRTGALRGRADCLALLRREWISARHGGARGSTLLGLPGMGKTRAAQDFATSVGLAGTKVIIHKCDASSIQFPLSLFAGILPELWQMRGSLGIAPHHRAVLGRLAPSTSEANALETGAALERLRVELDLALVDLLEAVTAERQLLVVVDDAHLLDDTSLALLKRLGTTTNSAALLIVACCRPRDRVSSLVASLGRTTAYTLPALDDAESRLLLEELDPDRRRPEARVEWCIREANGNPFFLHSLSRVSSNAAPVPFDIASLASTSYHSLSQSARLALECCLYLDTLATLGRLVSITGLDDLSLIAVLRELEENDLVQLQGSVVRGPHALLDEALRALIPSTVSALIHRRIAHALTTECSGSSYSIPVALAAARSWVAYGDSEQAESLLRRSAADIAAIGDPRSAADLLTQIAYDTSPVQGRRVLLDDIIKYAEAGGAREIFLHALRDRIALAQHLEESRLDVARMQFRLMAASPFEEGPASGTVAQLSAMLSSDAVDDELRLQCVATLMIIADAHFDRKLADTLAPTLLSLTERQTEHSPYALRALLIYHTTFGDTRIALDVATELTRRFTAPSLDNSSRMARRSASFAMYRMMRHAEARVLLENDYEFTALRGIRSEAVYAASLLTEIEISAGRFDAARQWFKELDVQLSGAAAHKLTPNSGYYSSAALFAMMDGDYARAHRILDIPLAEDARMGTPRYEAILTALRLRAHLMDGTLLSESLLVSRLRELYARGRSMGGMDTVVELLWCAEVLDGKQTVASELLNQYLTDFRREEYPVEWFLRTTTAADHVWSKLDSRRVAGLA